MPEPLTVNLDDATLGALDRIAARTERSRDWLVSEAIADYLAADKAAIKKIEEGLAAAEAGEFAVNEEIASLRTRFAPSK